MIALVWCRKHRRWEVGKLRARRWKLRCGHKPKVGKPAMRCFAEVVE